MRFVNKFTPPDFQAKHFTQISTVSGDENTKKCVKIEKFTPLAVTISPLRTRPEIIISGSSRMPTYRTFQYLEEYIVSSLQYRVYSITLEKAEPGIPGVPLA